jgi:hypothetical protein
MAADSRDMVTAAWQELRRPQWYKREPDGL